MKFIDRYISLLAPLQCLGCQKEGCLVCQWCKPDIIDLPTERCIACNRLSADARTCRSCRKKYKLPKHVWSRAEYDGHAKEILHQLKFSRTYSAGKIVAELLDDALPYLEDNTVVTHVPTAPARVRQRGYDQSALIAGSVAKSRELKHQTILTRLSNARQVGSSREKRKKQLEQAFYVKQLKKPTNKPVLIVDDMYTTGGTLMSATTALKQAGYKNILAVIFARAR